MGFYLAYRYVLSVVIGGFVLYLFFTTRKHQIHKGWWCAFLFFGLSVAFLLPMKANPFEADKIAHEQSVAVLKQLDNLTIGGWLSEEKLADNVTDKTIQEVKKQLPLVEKRNRKKAKKQLDLTWNCLHIQQTEEFFRDHFGWQMDSSFNYPEKEKINAESFSKAHELLNQLDNTDKKTQLEKYLKQCEELVAQP